MHNEVSGTVHGHVVQARDIGTVNVHGTEPDYPPLTSWSDRPDLTDELRDLMHVQRDAAETLPYRLLGVKQPELTRVYVQQSVRAQPDAEGSQSERAIPIGEALMRDRHLLITGEPGAGKSTLGQMYVQRLADEWLDPSNDPPLPEPVMPLRIPAKALADDLPWSALLAKAASNRHLNAELQPILFARRALGARWLVFVDGLDEIAEPDRRQRVIDALASRIRRGTDLRLVITTRPLPPEELQKLHGSQVDLFTVQPFGPVELKHFADGWFRAQNPLHAKERAEAFVQQVHDGRLRELVRNPLLVTIAAIANTLEPNRKLPHNRADLYERFMSYLLDDKPSGRTTFAELCSAHADDPQRVEQIKRLYLSRKDLIEHVAAHRLESEEPLLIIASAWLTSPVNEDDVLAVLASTGVFVHGDGGLRFLHHSFAEFLAARLRARSIPADFPNLDEWVELGTQSARETSVLFTFALWGRKHGHDLDLVIERLLEGGAKHTLLAGRLLAEDVAITSARSSEVVNRLVQLLLANGVKETPWGDARGTGRVLAGLDNESIARLLVPKLRGLLENTDLPRVVRIGCAVALGHLYSAKFAAKWLQEYADVRCTNALTAITAGLAEILPNGGELAEALLLRLIGTTDSYSVGLDVVSILMFDLDRRAAASTLLRDIVQRMRADMSIQPGTPHIPHSGALADAGPAAWETLAMLANALRCTEEAIWAAEQVLAKSSVEIDEFSEAAEILLSHGGKAALDVVAARARSLTLEHVLIVAEKAGAVPDLDRSVALDPSASDEQFVRACLALARFEPDEAIELVKQRPSLGSNNLMRLADVLAVSGRNPYELTRRALLTRTGNRREFRTLVRTALALGHHTTDVHDLAAAGPPVQRAVAAVAFYDAGHTEWSRSLVESLVSDPLDAESAIICLSGMVIKEIPAQAQELFDRLMAVVRQNAPGIARRLAPILHRIGRADQAAEVAVDAFLRSLGGNEVADCANVVLNVSGAAHADLIVSKVRESNLSVWQRMDIADLFVNEGMLHQATTMWLDVVRNHGMVIDKGIDAASKLVMVGQRAQAIDTVRNAMAHDPHTSTARANMKALLAWLEA